MTDSNIPSFADMLDVLERNPFKALQLAGKAHRGVNRRSWEIAGIACGFARILTDDEKARDDFYDEEFFEDRKRARPGKLLLHVFAYLYGALSGPAYNRASEHARALQKVCDDRSIEPADIPQHIADHGGFDGLLNEQEDDQEETSAEEAGSPARRRRTLGEAIQQREATKAVTKISEDDSLHDDDEDDEDDLVPGEGEDDEPVVGPRRKILGPQNDEQNLKLLPRPYIQGCIILRPKPDDFAKIMKAYLDGKEVIMTTKPGDTSSTHELYAGGGPFVEALIKEHDAP